MSRITLITAALLLSVSSVSLCKDIHSSGADERPTASDAPRPVAADARLRVPTDSELAEAMKLLKDLYGDAYEQARTSAEKEGLAKKLLQAVEKTANSAERFAILRLSRDVAASAGSAELAFQAIDAIAQHFNIDALSMKLKVLEQSASRATTKDQRLVVVRCASALQEEYVLTDAFEDAIRVGQLCAETAKLALDPPLTKTIIARNRQIEELAKTHAIAMAALAALKKNPKDADANSIAGRYFCLVKGDWITGLPMLANGSDRALKELATKDLAGGSSTESQTDLGDLWWTQAQTESGVGKRRLMERALLWYSKAAPTTSGLIREKLENRMSKAKVEFPGIVASGAIAATEGGTVPHDMAPPSWQFVAIGDFPGGVLGSSANGVSADGRTVVGSGTTSESEKAFRWTPTNGLMQLENSRLRNYSTGVSADGSIVVGWSWDEKGTRPQAFLWSSATGIDWLGDLPGGTVESYATDISSDGLTIVGHGHGKSGYEAFRWSKQSGMIGLGDLPGGKFQSGALGISANGLVIVGVGHTDAGQEACRWSKGTGMTSLGDLPGGIQKSLAEEALANGDVVVGYGNSSAGQEAFRWTVETGMVGLGDLPGGAFQSMAWSGSEDGSVVVGEGTTALGSEAFIWDPVHGMRNLKEVLIEGGVDLANRTLTSARAMSSDGRTIVGHGLNPAGEAEAWVATRSP